MNRMSTLELFRALKWAQTEATGECCVDITRQLQRQPSLMTQNLVACKKQRVDVPIDRHLIIKIRSRIVDFADCRWAVDSAAGGVNIE